MWAKCVRPLPSSQLSFIMNATNETLPSNANLVLWKKRTCDKCPLCQRRQTILHVLNNCEVLVRNGHYNTRHDSILHLLLKEAIKYLPPRFNIYADHKDSSTHFPTHIIATSQRPDIVIWRKDSTKVYFVELTICHETNFDAANEGNKIDMQN